MDKSKMNETEQNLLMHEIKTMEQLHHPNIIQLCSHIRHRGKLSENDCKPNFAQIVSAISYMHSKNIIHRDIKAENVLISAPDWIKLADFGFACQVNPDDMLTTFCGSPAYAAPELFKNGRYCGKSADVWAVGVLLYFMLVGRTPFRGETISNLKECILRGVYPLPNYLSGSAQRVISQMLIIDPKKRSTIDEIKSCNFLKNCQFTESYIQCGIIVRNKLRFYGIDEAIIQDGASKGIRSAAIGTYRIVLHQAQQDYHQQERNQVCASSSDMIKFRNDHVMVKRGKSSLALISDSRTCSLL
uniref:Protein kinase domain-containing protein n=1 Tax=Elaeophora elaphi TaxID=1147741 RepID=A0A0R3RYX0_9BILA